MESIENIFKERKLQPGSIKLYISNLKRLNDGNDIIDIKFLEDIKSILSKIEKNKKTTQRNYFITICSVLKHIPKYEDLYKQYYELLTSFNAKLKDNTDKSASQIENWINQEQVLEVYNSVKDKALKVIKDGIKTKQQYDLLLDWLVLSLYTLIPPRRLLDYQLMLILPYKIKKGTVLNNDFNYLDLKNHKFIFNNYKTAKSYHSVEIEIPDDLFQVISIYLKHFQHKKLIGKEPIYLLCNFYGENLSQPNMITKILNNIFQKKISVSMLRNIYLTCKYSAQEKEMNKDAKMMSTSTEVMKNNYIKK